jgi:hypothetical protein
MIVKFEDEYGVSLYDYVVHVSRLNDESTVKMTRATLDHNLVGNEFDHGSLTILSDKGVIISQYDLGPKLTSDPGKAPN